MIDVQVLKGAEVRSSGGSRGFLDVVTPARVRVRWEESDGSHRVESCLRSDTRLGQIEVLTLNSGWTALKAVLGMEENVDDISKLTTDLRDMLGEDALDEKSKHWPYKNKSTLGTTGAPKHGPPPRKTRSVGQTDDWVCKKKGKYVQICRGPEGRKKLVRINKSYKKGYNKAYRAWKASQTKKSKGKKK